MTILVTGANGFIGSHVVYTLLKRGHIVRALVREQADLRSLESLDVELVRGDLLTPATVLDAAAGCRAVIHTAGLASTSPFNTWRVWETNLVGTANVLTAASTAGVEKFIHTASIFSLGVGAQDQPVNENVRDNLSCVRIPYVVARRAADAKAEKLLAGGMPIVLVYPTYCIGPGLYDLRASPYRQIVAFLRGRMPFYSPGGLNVVDVRDVAEALVFALEHGGVGSKYLVGGENVSFRELFERLGRVANRRPPVLSVPNGALVAGGWVMQWFSSAPLLDVATARLMRYKWYYDSSKARRELGYIPRPLDDTLRDMVAWLREQHYIR